MGNLRLQFAGFLCLTLLMAAAVSAAMTTTSKSKHLSSSPKYSLATHSASRKHSVKHSTAGAARTHAQRGIDAERTQAIQSALIREHYMSGTPTGVWDQQTKDALAKYQADNGWQTKITPDSRALIKLGLGSDHKGLLNPETANIPSPHELGVDNPAQPGGSADQR